MPSWVRRGESITIKLILKYTNRIYFNVAFICTTTFSETQKHLIVKFNKQNIKPKYEYMRWRVVFWLPNKC